MECGIIIGMLDLLMTRLFRQLACLVLVGTQLPGGCWLLLNDQGMQVFCATLLGALLGSHLRPLLGNRTHRLLLLMLSARLIELAPSDDHVRWLLDQGLVPLMVVVLWPSGPGTRLYSGHTRPTQSRRAWSTGVPIHPPAAFFWNAPG
jgi:hypothetical protein